MINCARVCQEVIFIGTEDEHVVDVYLTYVVYEAVENMNAHTVLEEVEQTEIWREGNRFSGASHSFLATVNVIGGTDIAFPLTLSLKMSSYLCKICRICL